MEELTKVRLREDHLKHVRAYLGLSCKVRRESPTALCRMDTTRTSVLHTFARQALPMAWDFAETNPFGRWLPAEY